MVGNPSPDALVIGGGAIGLSIALRLAQGGLTVTVADRQEPVREASAAAAGMLASQYETAEPLAWLQFCCQSRELYSEFAEELLELSGTDVEYDDRGTLCPALDDADEEYLRGRARWLASVGQPVEELSGEDLLSREPSLNPRVTYGLYLPHDHKLDIGKFGQALHKAAVNTGVTFLTGLWVTDYAMENGRVVGIAGPPGRVSAGTVINAAGAWSGLIGTSQPVRRPLVKPIRGQIAALEMSPGAHVGIGLHTPRGYLVPGSSGRLLVGSTMEDVGFDKRATAEAISWLLSRAIDIVPSLARCSVVDMWAGFRPDTPDHLPILGESGTPGLYFATGHFRNGILLAPKTAAAIAELVVTGRPSQDMDLFSIQRFAETPAEWPLYAPVGWK